MFSSKFNDYTSCVRVVALLLFFQELVNFINEYTIILYQLLWKNKALRNNNDITLWLKYIFKHTYQIEEIKRKIKKLLLGISLKHNICWNYQIS